VIRIAVVDDQELVRTGLRALAEHEGDIEVVVEAADGRSGLAAVRLHRPDAVLMDIRMPVMDGLDATAAIVADPALAGVRVVVLTTFDDDEDVLRAVRTGAVGYLLKDIAPADLRRAVRVVAAGGSLLDPAITGRVLAELAGHLHHRPRPELLDGLTGRERDVLRRVGLGESNAEVGASLHLSPATARTYVSRLLAKLGSRDRAGLVALAYESGLVVPGQADR